MCVKNGWIARKHVKEDFAYNFKEIRSRKGFLLFIACSVVCRHLKLDEPDKFFIIHSTANLSDLGGGGK